MSDEAVKSWCLECDEFVEVNQCPRCYFPCCPEAEEGK